MPTVAPLDPALLARLEALRLSVRQVRWGSHLGGRFQINRRGSSIEFADYVPYTPGDDIRSIDWNLYARLDKLFMKTYKEEVELSVEIIVDATASMMLPRAEKFSRACQVGLCLAYVGLAGRHHVRMSWMRPGRPASTPWCFHRADVQRLMEWTKAVDAGGAIRMQAWIGKAVTALRMRGGQAIMISDCMHPPADAFRAWHGLMRKHLEVKVIQVLSPEELNPARLFRSGVLVDSETGLTHELAYRPEELAQAVVTHNETLARFCKRNGIAFAQHRLDEPVDAFLLKALPARGFLE